MFLKKFIEKKENILKTYVKNCFKNQFLYLKN